MRLMPVRLGSARVARYDEPHIISELRKVCVGSAHVHAFVYIVLHAGGARSHIGCTRRAGGCEAGARMRARACLHACACVWLPSPMELANAQRPAKRRPGTAAPACGHLRHSVGGSRLGPYSGLSE
jgi:hypothetical protein